MASMSNAPTGTSGMSTMKSAGAAGGMGGTMTAGGPTGGAMTTQNRNTSGMDMWAMDPFNLSSTFDMMLRDPLGRGLGMLSEGLRTMPTMKVDIAETDTAYNIIADAPGMSKEQLNVEVDADNVLHLSSSKRSERKDEGERGGRRYHRIERSSEAMHRSIKLPANADVGRVAAKYENGVLSVSIPKLAGTGGTDRRQVAIM